MSNTITNELIAKLNKDSAPQEPAPATNDVERCPACGHMPHRAVCFNMASDNECNCKYGTPQALGGEATARPIAELIGILQGAELELAERDGYDYGRPLAIRVAINSLLAGLGVEPKDLEGEVETATDPGLVVWGREIIKAVTAYDTLAARVVELREQQAFLGGAAEFALTVLLEADDPDEETKQAIDQLNTALNQIFDARATLGESK